MRFLFTLLPIFFWSTLHGQDWAYAGPEGAYKRTAVILTGKTTAEKMKEGETIYKGMLDANTVMVRDVNKLLWDTTCTDADRRRILERHWELATRRAMVSENITYALRHVAEEKDTDMLKRYKDLGSKSNYLKAFARHFLSIIDSKAESSKAHETRKYPAHLAITREKVDMVYYNMKTTIDRWSAAQEKRNKKEP